MPEEGRALTEKALEERLRSLSPEKRALLERRLHRKGGTALPREVGSERPLTSAQRWVWAFEQFNPHTPVYNLVTSFRIVGPFDEERFSRAVDALCEKHPALHSRVVIRDGDVLRRIESVPQGLLNVVSLEGADSEARARAWVDKEASTPFDLFEEDPIRVSLLRLGPEDRILMIVVHHIVSDGWSFGVLLNDLAAFYKGDGGATKRPVAASSPAPRDDNSAAEDRIFWEEMLGDPPDPLSLPRDRSLPAIDPWAGGIVDFEVPPSLERKVAGATRTLGATPFMLWLASFSAVLHRHSGQDDFLVGVPVARRDSIESLEVVDYLVDLVPLRLRFDNDPSFLELVQQIKSSASQVFQRAEGALDHVIEKLSMSGTDSVYQAAVTFTEGRSVALEALENDVSIYDVHTGTCKADLTLMFGPKGPHVGQLEYRRKDFGSETIERFADQLLRLFEWALDHPESRVSELPLMSGAEERHWTIDVNRTRTDYPKSSVLDVFREVVTANPEAPAIAQGDVEISYRELDRRSSAVARRLNGMSLGADRRVGLYMERSIDLAVATVGIVKAGGTYVPLDPSYPDERISFMLEDAGIQAVVVDPKLSFPDSLTSSVSLVDVREVSHSNTADEDAWAGAGPEDPLYVMYTSGSTGIPKGVVVPHRAVVRLVRDTNYVSLGHEDVLGHISNVSFDAATFEIWGAFLNGGTLAVIDKYTLLSPPDLVEALREHGVTAMFMTAALFNVISVEDPTAFSGVRNLLVGGEALDVGRIRAVLEADPPARLMNGYGPTETTTFAAWQLIESVGENDRSIPIGKPLANTFLYVLDAHLRPVPPGVSGQLFIGGDGVALGYLNDPDLTERRFVEDPFMGGRMYATGDIARRLPDGSVDYVGRADRQVKVRGFRVELGEIETAMRSHGSVAEALVLVKPSENGHKELEAYIVPERKADPITSDVVRDHLRAKLPGYMVPGHIQVIARFPLTPNGKVDRERLASMHNGAAPVVPTSDPPRDQLEEQILEVWTQVLGTSEIGIHADFFDVGGNSLLAVQLFARIEAELGFTVELATFMENPTIEGGARMLREEVERSSPEGLVCLNTDGGGLPFFCVPAHGGNVFHIYKLARCFAGARPVYGLQGPPTYRFAKTSRSAEELADYYVGVIRSIQPQGPYFVGGFSMGGLIAFEIGRRFALTGELGLVGLIDTLDPEGTQARFGTGLNPVMTRARARLKAEKGMARLRVLGRVARYRMKRWRRGVMVRVLSRTNRTVPPATRYEYFMRMHDEILSRYKPAPFPGSFTLFATADLTSEAKEDWRHLAAGEMAVYDVPGEHGTLTESPNVDAVAAIMIQVLDEAERAAAPSEEAISHKPS